MTQVEKSTSVELVEIVLAPLRQQMAQIVEDLREIRVGQTVQISDLRQRAEAQHEQIGQIRGSSGELSKGLARIEDTIRGVESRLDDRLHGLENRMPSIDRLSRVEADVKARAHGAELKRLKDDVKEIERDVEDVQKILASADATLRIIKWIGVVLAGMVLAFLWEVFTGEVQIIF